jgi:pyruvate dehydrogenase E2 component (dihydrolipoamide acetyltransferase)
MDVKLPRLGEGADSGTVASIFVKEGDQVKKDQPILELESEKAVATIPSPEAGTVTRIHVHEGDEIRVGQLIFSLGGDGEPGQSVPTEVIDLSVGDEESAGDSETPVPSDEPLQAPPTREPGTTLPPGIPPAASPSIRKLARELAVDLSYVKGSERGGRIVMGDLRRYIRHLQQAVLKPPVVPQEIPLSARPAPVSPDYSRWGPVRKERLSTLRKTISTKMGQAWSAVPHVTQFDEADITTLLALKKRFGARYSKKGGHLTVTSFALIGLVDVLKRHPVFNASLDVAAGEVVYKEYIHIGIAVDTEQGLIVPVIRDADQKSLLALSVELGQLAERTRDRKVSLDEMQGASFTVSNQGGIGSAHFTPIVNTPQVAILGIGRGTMKPVVRGSRVEKRIMLPVSLSYDHRIIDGADAARFMVDLVTVLEGYKEADVKAGLR